MKSYFEEIQELKALIEQALKSIDNIESRLVRLERKIEHLEWQ